VEFLFLVLFLSLFFLFLFLAGACGSEEREREKVVKHLSFSLFLSSQQEVIKRGAAVKRGRGRRWNFYQSLCLSLFSAMSCHVHRKNLHTIAIAIEF
jgi:hypothetical protein